jgi:hypothetical protein
MSDLSRHTGQKLQPLISRAKERTIGLKAPPRKINTPQKEKISTRKEQIYARPYAEFLHVQEWISKRAIGVRPKFEITTKKTNPQKQVGNKLNSELLLMGTSKN